MRGDVETIKDRLDIAEIVGGYVKLEKAGVSFKARCPFHNEKTPSFFVSPARQSYYCFGCGAKGDIFTFVQEVEGLGFREALQSLAERAGIELSNRPEDRGADRTEKDKVLEVLEEAKKFFEKELAENKEARDYIASRGINAESVKAWNIGYARAEWRSLYSHLLERGYPEEVMIKAGLIKKVEPGSGKSPYDVFRDRIIFPLKDTSGQVIAFSGRALAKETEPKYLNSPDTIVFSKHEVLYGLDKAKDKIRRKDYAVLVEGQVDLILSHQVGVDNTVASSGTAFTQAHLERLKRFSSRIILAFDGDEAGEKAAEKSSELGLSLGLEVKIAKLPEGLDPAEVAKIEPDKWKSILRDSKHCLEYFLNRIIEEEQDRRKLGKLIEKKILPLLTLLSSSIERSHFLSLVASRTGIKEEILWEDLKRARKPDISQRSDLGNSKRSDLDTEEAPIQSRREQFEERLTELRLWQKELPEGAAEAVDMKKEEEELMDSLSHQALREELGNLSALLSAAETSKDQERVEELTKRISSLHKEILALEEKKNIS